MAMFGLRLGENPQVCITTTPKPIPLVQKFIQWSKDPEKGMLITTGSSYENKANLADSFFNQIVQYEGTTLGRQEIHAEVINLEDQGIIKRSYGSMGRIYLIFCTSFKVTIRHLLRKQTMIRQLAPFGECLRMK
jgi:phage terminase large subunit-like protein